MIDNVQKSQRRRRIFRYAPLFLWLGLILFLSTGQASMSNTSRFVRPLLTWLFPAAPEELLNVYHGYVRKFAHFAEYAILAFFASFAFFGSTHKFLQKYWYVVAFILVFLTAAIDETNQSFMASRTGSVYDVLLDVSGGLFMISVLALYRYVFKK